VDLVIGMGLLMAYSVGANDVANAMGTSVGSRALTVRRAILAAAVFEFLGAFLAGGEVTKTIRGGILVPEKASAAQADMLCGMLAALAAAGTWLIAASRLGWPVSTTHSIVGAIAGFGAVALGMDAVEWAKLSSIAASWVISPVLAGAVSFVVIRVITRTILDHDDPVERTRRYGCMYVFKERLISLGALPDAWPAGPSTGLPAGLPGQGG
jgi:PiT family inorganic phosphate transporter